VVYKPLELVYWRYYLYSSFYWSKNSTFAGGVWKSLETRTREALEGYKQSLMGDSGGSSEDQNTNKECKL
jgi:hypothetical protein